MAWAKPTIKKNALSAVAAFEDVLNETRLRLSNIWADKGLCVVQKAFSFLEKKPYHHLTYHLSPLPPPHILLLIDDC